MMKRETRSSREGTRHRTSTSGRSVPPYPRNHLRSAWLRGFRRAVLASNLKTYRKYLAMPRSITATTN